MQPIDIVFIAYCLYVPFLVLLYVAEPGTPFKGSFYMLFMAAFVVDVVMVGATFAEFRMVSYPLVNGLFANYTEQVGLRTRMTLAFICPFTQDLLNCFIALNRLTAIMQPTQADDLWKKLLPFSICFSYLLSIAIFTPAGARDALYVKIPGTNAFTVIFDERYIPWFNGHLITTIEMALTSVIIIVLYSMAALSLRKLVGSAKMKKKERMLLKIGVVTFAISVPGIFMQLLIGFKILPAEWTLIFFYAFGLIVDTKCLMKIGFAAALSMIIVNKPFRDHLLSSLHLSRPERVNTVKVGSVSDASKS